MADEPKDPAGPRLVGPNGRRVRVPGELTVHDRHELMLDELRAELRANVARLWHAAEDAKGALEIHQQALLELVPLVQELQQRTVRGRIRRLKAWFVAEWALWREIIRDRLGIEPSPTLAQLREVEAAQVRRSLEPPTAQ